MAWARVGVVVRNPANDFKNSFMTKKYKVNEINIGCHPDGYRIDKSASPMNLYTKWRISEDGRWHGCEPVDFDVLPWTGWIKCESFDWDEET